MDITKGPSQYSNQRHSHADPDALTTRHGANSWDLMNNVFFFVILDILSCFIGFLFNQNIKAIWLPLNALESREIIKMFTKTHYSVDHYIFFLLKEYYTLTFLDNQTMRLKDISYTWEPSYIRFDLLQWFKNRHE